MSDPLVVDTHTHIIAADTDRYPLNPPGLPQFGGEGRRRADWFETHAVSGEKLIHGMNEAGVDRVVLVQAMGAYGYDNSYCADAAALHAHRATSVAIVDPHGSDPVAELTRWVRDRGMRGVRLFAISDPTWLDREPGTRLLEAAAQLHVPVVATVLPTGIPHVESILARFPSLPIALDHCGFPNLQGGPPYDGAAPLFALAGFENLHLKVSGCLLAQIESAGGRPADFVGKVAAEFGARRLLWGSDYPQTHDRSYPALVALCRAAAANLSDADRDEYLGGTALRLWPELR